MTRLSQPPLTKNLSDLPRVAGAQLTAGPVHLAGMAWAPSIGIARVQVQIDNGPWHDAELGTVVSADTWVHWSYVWTEASKGDHVAAVRATETITFFRSMRSVLSSIYSL